MPAIVATRRCDCARSKVARSAAGTTRSASFRGNRENRVSDDALGVFSLSLFFFSPPKRARRCQGLIYANEKKKVIVVCKTTTHRDGEQTTRKHVAREKIYIYSRTWVRLFVSSFVFHSLYSRSDVCDCVCVCVRVTRRMFFLCYLFAVFVSLILSSA